MAELKDIAVATASTPMQAQSSALGAFAQLGQAALAGGEIVAKQVGKSKAEAAYESLLQDADAAISAEEGRAGAAMTERAKKLRSKFEQGLLTSAALQVELEKELRDISQSFGGLYGDTIYNAAVKEIGVDPRGSRLAHQIERVKEAEDALTSGPLDKYNLSKEDHALVYGAYLRNTSIPIDQHAVRFLREKSMAHSMEQKLAQMQASKEIDQFKAEDFAPVFEIEAERIMSDVMSNIGEVAKGGVFREEDVAAFTEEFRSQLMNRGSALYTEQGFGQPTAKLLKMMEDKVTQATERLGKIAKAYDSLDNAVDREKFAQAMSQLAFRENEPMLSHMADNLPPEVLSTLMTVSLESFTAQYAPLRKYFFNEEGAMLTPKEQLDMIGLAYAYKTGNPKIIAQNPEADAALKANAAKAGITVEELSDRIIEHGNGYMYLQDKNATPSGKNEVFQMIASTSIDETLMMLSKPEYFAGVIKDQGTADIFSGVFTAKIGNLSSKVGNQKIQVPTKFLNAGLIQGSAQEKGTMKRSGQRGTEEATITDLMAAGHIDLEMVDRGNRVELQVVFSENFEDNILGGNRAALAEIERQVDTAFGKSVSALGTVLRKAESNLKPLLNNAGIPSYKELPQLLRSGFASERGQPQSFNLKERFDAGEAVNIFGVPVVREPQ